MSNDKALNNERFGFTVFVSACLHVMLIAGVGFSFLSESESAPAIDVTLAQYRSEQAPEEADFVAQENQAGSGSLEERAAPSTPFEARFQDEVFEEVNPVPQTPPSGERTPSDPVVTARESEEERARPEETTSENRDRPSETESPEDLSVAIAAVQARLDRQKQAYANRPRRYTISSASTKKRHDAEYLDSWRRRIETVGNRNYPAAARRQDIYGSLRMMVELRPDGSVQEIEILQSSGHRVLDEAAVRIVQLASPFDPFPEELRGEVDILEIIRTWRFQPGNSFSSQ